jgi:hypothetical protein
MCKRNFFLLAVLFLPLSLWSHSGSGFFTKQNTNIFGEQSKKPAEQHLSNWSIGSGTLFSNYNPIWKPLNITFEKQTDSQSDPNNPTSGLSDMLNYQLESLLELENLWREAEARFLMSSQYNELLLDTLSESKETIALLRMNLEAALERIADAENGAIALLDENAAIYNQARYLIARNAFLEQQLASAKQSAVIGWAIGGVSFALGAPLVVEGIRSDNRTMVWAGVAAVAVPNAIYALGRFMFDWF